MLSQGALMSITCNIQEPYTLQILDRCSISPAQSRIFISDGTTYMCADVPTARIKEVKPYALVKMLLSFHGVGVPLKMQQMEIVQKDYDDLIGSPIPFTDYVRNGYKHINLFKNHSNESEPNKITQESCLSSAPLEKKARSVGIPQKQNQLFSQQNILCAARDSQELSNTILISKTQPLPVQQSDPYVPIDMLYQSLRGWKILGRVIWVDVKEIASSKGRLPQQVEVLNFVILDQQSNRAECSAFGKASEKWKSVIRKGQMYQFSNGRILSSNAKGHPIIRFQSHSTVVYIPETASNKWKVPFHSFKLISLHKLHEVVGEDELDVGGMVKKILFKEMPCPSNKHRIKFVMADPTVGKQVQVLLQVNPQNVEDIVEDQIVIVSNVKVVKGSGGTISLKSGFRTDIVTSFKGDQEQIQQFLPFVRKNLSKVEFTSLSSISYKTRTLKRHLQSLQIAPPEQKIYSKINLYLSTIINTNRIFYEACSKCSKKIVKTTARRSNYCQGYACRKIVETKKQYCLKAVFADWGATVNLTLFKDMARAILGLGAEEFARMEVDEQSKHLNGLRFKQMSVCISSSKDGEQIKHEVHSISEPHAQHLTLINEMLQMYHPFMLKQQAQ